MRDQHDDPSATDPLPGLSGVGRAGALAPTAPTRAAEVDPVAASAAAGASAEVEAVAATNLSAADPVRAIGEALAASAIDAEQARCQLIEAVVASQMPPGADPAVWQQIRLEVEALLAGDPTLADLLRR